MTERPTPETLAGLRAHVAARAPMWSRIEDALVEIDALTKERDGALALAAELGALREAVRTVLDAVARIPWGDIQRGGGTSSIESLQGSTGRLRALLASPSTAVAERDARLVAEGAAATALLMRELICERVYRERANWNADHPNKAMRIRKITPESVVAHATSAVLTMDGDALKAHAATVLDLIEAASLAKETP